MPAPNTAPDTRAPAASREPQPARAASGPVEALREELEVDVDAAAPLAPSGGSLPRNVLGDGSNALSRVCDRPQRWW